MRVRVERCRQAKLVANMDNSLAHNLRSFSFLFDCLNSAREPNILLDVLGIFFMVGPCDDEEEADRGGDWTRI